MKRISFQEALEQIIREDARYHEQSYYFLREALDFTIKLLSKPPEGPGRHVKGEELLEGIRQYTLQEYGPLAKTVLNHWGIERCEDFGEMVFHMVEKGVLGKTEEDKLGDFAGGFDFDVAFRKPYRPRVQSVSPNSASSKN